MFQFSGFAPFGDWSSTSRVAPFGNPRIYACLQLPTAYRSLSRPSSPVHAKASSIRHNLLKSCHCTWFGLVPFFDALMSRYFVYNGYHVKPADRNRQTQHANFTFALSDIFQKTSLLYRVAYCATEQSLHQRTGQESYLSALA